MLGKSFNNLSDEEQIAYKNELKRIRRFAVFWSYVTSPSEDSKQTSKEAIQGILLDRSLGIIPECLEESDSQKSEYE